MKNRLALVTGASRGIGQAIALGLGREGAIVVGTATTAEGAENITQTLEKAGVQGCGLVLNVASQESINTAMTTMKERYGMPTILVNNALNKHDSGVKFWWTLWDAIRTYLFLKN